MPLAQNRLDPVKGFLRDESRVRAGEIEAFRDDSTYVERIGKQRPHLRNRQGQAGLANEPFFAQPERKGAQSVMPAGVELKRSRHEGSRGRLDGDVRASAVGISDSRRTRGAADEANRLAGASGACPS